MTQAASRVFVHVGSPKTGTTFLQIDRVLPAERSVRFVGIDASPEMLEKARGKLAEAGFAREHEFRCADLNKAIDVERASVVIMNLTLQFIRPLYRDRLGVPLLCPARFSTHPGYPAPGLELP